LDRFSAHIRALSKLPFPEVVTDNRNEAIRAASSGDLVVCKAGEADRSRCQRRGVERDSQTHTARDKLDATVDGHAKLSTLKRTDLDKRGPCL
jgi:hypothetical protein